MLDVIVPVYRGWTETRACLESVMSSQTRTRFELVVIDDASPDARIEAYLERLASARRISLLKNDRNHGFVHSANMGMALHFNRDVVLLNSDTEVANDWLDRLRSHAMSDAGVGTITPFSNNATICSYPYEGWPGGIPGSLSLPELDSLFGRILSGRSVEIPTAVGFCMYIRRACLNQVGLFDAETFGRGYGEENDFCMRASEVGWRHVLAADVFVFHVGGVSFSEERFELQRSALAALLAKHPNYLDEIAKFRKKRSIVPLRETLDAARIEIGDVERGHVLTEQYWQGNSERSMLRTCLHILHGWGGGAARWVADYCSMDTSCRNLVLRSCSDRNHTGRWIELLEVGAGETAVMRWELAQPINGTAIEHPQYRSVIEMVCDTFSVGSVVVSSLIGHSLSALETGLPTSLVLHDLYPYCSAVFGFFDGICTSCPSEEIDNCLRANTFNPFWHNTNTEEWIRMREAFLGALVDSSIRIFSPSQSVWNRWVGLVPELIDRKWDLIEHGIDSAVFRRIALPEIHGDRKFRVVIPGRLLPHKGLLLVREVVARLAGEMEFLLLGCGMYGASFKELEHVQVIKDYEQAEFPQRMECFGPDIAVLASVLPESFSYTLSELFAIGLPVAATRLGAFAERIEDGRTGFLVEPDADSMISALRRLDQDRELLSNVRAVVMNKPVRNIEEMLAAYRKLMPEVPLCLRTACDHSLIEIARRRKSEGGDLILAREEANRLSERIKLLVTENEKLVQESKKLTSERDAMLRSRSWTATGPLRRISTSLRKFRGNKLAHIPREEETPENCRLEVQGEIVRPAVSRSELITKFDLPDAIIVVVADLQPCHPVDELAEVVESTLRLRNDVCFLLPSCRLDEMPAGQGRDSLALHASSHRLFAGKDLVALEDALRCADVAFAFSDSENRQRFCLAAVRAGIPTIFFGQDSEPHTDATAKVKTMQINASSGAEAAIRLSELIENIKSDCRRRA